MKSLLICAITFNASLAKADASNDLEFLKYLATFNKSYSTEEEFAMRKQRYEKT